MLLLFSALCAADTGSDCPEDAIEGGSWNGTSCHYDVVADSPLAYCNIAVVKLLQCSEGSSIHQTGYEITSHSGDWYCDFSEDGEVVGATLVAGPFCCDGQTTQYSTAGQLNGTCIAPRQERDEFQARGCAHKQLPRLPVLGILALGIAVMARRGRA